MKLEFSANSNINSSVSLFLNNKQIFSDHSNKFVTHTDVETKFENTLDLHWNTNPLENIFLQIDSILLHVQKLNFLKSFYMPTQDAQKFIKHQMFHNGKLLWPGIVRFYFRIVKPDDYANKKLTDGLLIRKYNLIYV